VAIIAAIKRLLERFGVVERRILKYAEETGCEGEGRLQLARHTCHCLGL
jgi:hypothetical protein